MMGFNGRRIENLEPFHLNDIGKWAHEHNENQSKLRRKLDDIEKIDDYDQDSEPKQLKLERDMLLGVVAFNKKVGDYADYTKGELQGVEGENYNRLKSTIDEKLNDHKKAFYDHLTNVKNHIEIQNQIDNFDKNENSDNNESTDNNENSDSNKINNKDTNKNNDKNHKDTQETPASNEETIIPTSKEETVPASNEETIIPSSKEETVPASKEEKVIPTSKEETVPASSKSPTPTSDFIDDLPSEHNPFDDIGED